MARRRCLGTDTPPQLLVWPSSGLQVVWRTEARWQELSRKFDVPKSRWSKQSRIISKSGWVTTRAAATLPRRTVLQVMACQMGIHVVKVGSAIHDQEDERN